MNRRYIWCRAGRSASWASASSPHPPASRSFPTTGVWRTPGWRGRRPEWPEAEPALLSPGRGWGRGGERTVASGAVGRARAAGADTPSGLSRSARRDRDRAPRVPHAMVDGDVRAGAFQADGDLPGGGERRAAGGISDLLPLRVGLAPDEPRG